jgi:hypothetical protein
MQPGKVQKEKENKFLPPLAARIKVLTFANPISTTGAEIWQPKRSSKTLKKGLAERKRMPNFGSPNKGKQKNSRFF